MRNKKIGLALSGGGYRAAVFHVGVLSYLAENKLLENVSHVSTVSGGSIAMGLIYKLNNNQWPSNDEYIENILPVIKEHFTKKTLLGSKVSIFLARLSLINGNKALSKKLKNRWKITSSIQDIADSPVWTINTTTAETGKSWRIEKKQMGDYKLGYIKNPEIDLADAIAASAGFPVGIGPYKLDLSSHTFTPKDDKIRESIMLYDGGLYDNLGTEVFFQNNFDKLKNVDFLIVSDASKPVETKTVKLRKRVPRIIDISTEQIRSLRARLFHTFLHKSDNQEGMYIRIGQEHADLNKEALCAKSLETNLKKMSTAHYDCALTNGYTTAMKNFEAYYNNV